jgi:hypothetical protein
MPVLADLIGIEGGWTRKAACLEPLRRDGPGWGMSLVQKTCFYAYAPAALCLLNQCTHYNRIHRYRNQSFNKLQKQHATNAVEYIPMQQSRQPGELV